MLEKSFINVYDKFLKLNMYVTKNYRTDNNMKALLKDILFVLEDVNEHYYYEEINRRVEKDEKKEDTH
jgi:hypothetical protein